MKKITLVTGLALALVFPAGALAKPNPDDADKRAAKAECKTLRGGTAATREAFGTQFRSFAACVRSKAVEEAREERTAQRDAVRECKAQNAHPLGRCVSQHARQNEAEADQQDQEDATAQKNAAKECAAERDTLGAQVFGTTYGTENANYKNAFGKCVSKKARENDTGEQPAV